jgi:hypothetical protein
MQASRVCTSLQTGIERLPLDVAESAIKKRRDQKNPSSKEARSNDAGCCGMKRHS